MIIRNVTSSQNKRQQNFKAGFVILPAKPLKIIPMPKTVEMKKLEHLKEEVLAGKYKYIRTVMPPQPAFSVEDLFTSQAGEVISSGVGKGRAPFINTVMKRDSAIIHHYAKDEDEPLAILWGQIREELEKIKEKVLPAPKEELTH